MSLQWEDERYVRFYVRDTPSWMLGPWEARAVLGPVLRKLDRAGTMALGDDGLEAVAVAIQMPIEIVQVGMAWWLKRGTFELSDDGTLVAPNFIEAQEAKASDKKRAQECRERTRDKARQGALRVTNRDGGITNRDSASRTVTDRHADSEGVTLSRAVPSVPCRTVPNLAEPPREPLTLTGEPPRPNGKKGKAVPKHSPEHIALKDKIVDAFIAGVKSGKGIEPKLTHDGEHAAAFKLAKNYGDEAVGIMTRATADPFVLEKNCTIRYIESKADSWRGTAPVKPNGKPAPLVQRSGYLEDENARRRAAGEDELQ